ncbi:hypothetical protein KEJ36_05560 [Candidatus Bathyarchaeota archaeon]|nr:hypothetical protein [Candidatus Bathyarchaeota archaeon]MBS7628247.1 hypothetical protein [Candidatus Bathyarchaeota archaeon]
MEDAYALYKDLKEKAKEWNEKRLSNDPSYKTFEVMHPHVAKEILLKVRLRELKAKVLEATSLSQRERIKLEIRKVERELQRERLLQRTKPEYLQWRSRELRSVPRKALAKLKVALKYGFSNMRRRVGGALTRAIPPSISYLGSLDFSSEDLVRWSRGFLRARTSKKPRKPSIGWRFRGK